MNRLSRQTAATILALATLLHAAGSRADILDDIKAISRGAAIRAGEARDRAGEARDRATEVRDSAADIRDDFRDGLALVTDEMRTAVDEAVEDLERLIQETTEGREDFVADDGCSLNVCEPFRRDLISLFQNLQDLLNVLYDIAEMDSMHVDFGRLIRLLEEAPGRALFPVFQIVGEANNIFQGGLLDRLSETVDDLRTIRDSRDRVVLRDLRRGESNETRLDSELANCQASQGDPDDERTRATRLTQAALGLKGVGKFLLATGTIEISWVAGLVWVEAGYSPKWRKGVGLLFDKSAEVLFWFANDFAEDTRYCTQIVTRAELRDAIADPACEDDDAETECETQTKPDDPTAWSLASRLREDPTDGQALILEKEKEILANQATILEGVRRLKQGDLDNDGGVDLQDYAILQVGFTGP